MLGIMNQGGETPVDFFAPMRQSSLYFKGNYLSKARKSLSYTADGRLLVDGKPMESSSPEEMWNDIIIRVFAYQLKKRTDDQRMDGLLNRLSKRLLKRSAQRESIIFDNCRESSKNPFITTIKVRNCTFNRQHSADVP